VKLLYDENLSSALVAQLGNVYPGSAHVHDIGLGSADDSSVWRRAKDEGYCIVSKDSDYHDLSVLHGHPPKVIWLRLGNCSTATIFDCLRNRRTAIEEFGADEGESVLLIS
jgi:predicted nuclease of predicted toxin-antitoxin system